MPEERAHEYLQQLGISKDAVTEYILTRIHDIVNDIENRIYEVEDEQRKIEYKRWYPYHIDGAAMSALQRDIFITIIGNNDKIDRASDRYRKLYNSASNVMHDCLSELKGKHNVHVKIRGENQSYSMEINSQSGLEGFHAAMSIDRVWGVGYWLIPVEEENSDRARWLQESITETVGVSVKVTKAIAGSDDGDAVEITDWLNSEEGRSQLDEMEEWQNGLSIALKASSGEKVIVTKTREGALVQKKTIKRAKEKKEHIMSRVLKKLVRKIE